MAKLTEQEQQEIVRFIEAGKPLPDSHTTDALSTYKEIKELATNTPIIDKSKVPDVKCTKNIITYSDGRLSELSTKIEQLKNYIFKLQIHINTI